MLLCFNIITNKPAALNKAAGLLVIFVIVDLYQLDFDLV